MNCKISFYKKHENKLTNTIKPKIMGEFNWAQFGGGAANTLLGTGMGLLLEGHNDRRQLKQQGKLLEQQYGMDNKMAEANYERQMRLWEQTNYGAQMDQLQKAGLNPALMYKQGGPGGTTAAATGAVSSAKAPAGGMEIMNMMMQQAQIELLKAQTEKTKAEVPNVALTGENIKASTGSLLQGIENAKAQQELTEIQAGIASIEEHIKGMTQNSAIAMIRTELRAATATMHMLERNNTMDAATMKDKIKIVTAELAGIYTRNELTRQQTGKTEQETAKIIQEIDIALRQIVNTEKQTAIDQQIANFETSFGGQAANILHSLISILPGTRRKTNIVEHRGGQTNTTTHKRE